MRRSTPTEMPSVVNLRPETSPFASRRPNCALPPIHALTPVYQVFSARTPPVLAFRSRLRVVATLAKGARRLAGMMPTVVGRSLVRVVAVEGSAFATAPAVLAADALGA